MHLRQEIVAFLDLLERLAFVLASLEVFPQPFKGFDGLLNWLRVTIDSLTPFHLAFSDPECGIGGEGMGAMEIEEVVVLGDRFPVFLFFEEGFAPFHDDVGVVVFLDRIAQEDLFVGAAQGLLRGILRFGCAGTGSDDAEDERAQAEGCCET